MKRSSEFGKRESEVVKRPSDFPLRNSEIEERNGRAVGIPSKRTSFDQDTGAGGRSVQAKCQIVTCRKLLSGLIGKLEA